MEISQSLIDALRAAHLVCFASGMGVGLYFDFKHFRAMPEPLTTQNVEELESLHYWINLAFAGLWLTGIALIYVRTSFNIAAFTPKLWAKLGIMSLMLCNARLIGTIVIKTLRANIGVPLICLPYWRLFGLTQVGVFSMFCWTYGLLLGSSVTLKTAGWELIVPWTLGWFMLLSCLTHAAVWFTRRNARPTAAIEPQH